MYNIECIIQCTVYSIECIIQYTVHSTVYSAQKSAQYTGHSRVYSVQCTVQCTVYDWVVDMCSPRQSALGGRSISRAILGSLLGYHWTPKWACGRLPEASPWQSEISVDTQQCCGHGSWAVSWEDYYCKVWSNQNAVVRFETIILDFGCVITRWSSVEISAY